MKKISTQGRFIFFSDLRQSTVPTVLRGLFVLFFVILALNNSAQAQIINTIAGSTYGYSGDGGPATAALLGHPAEMAFDAWGNIYFSDYGNSRVRKISATGIITTIGGNGTSTYTGDGGPATAAGIILPGYIATKGTDIYVSENSASVIRKINAAGIISTIAGTGTSGYGGDGGPATNARINSLPGGIAFDRYGNLYLADENNNRIRKIDTLGIITTIAGTGATGYSGDGGPATDALLDVPNDVAFDAAGNLYFVEKYNGIVRKVNPSGIISTFAGNGTTVYGGDGGPASAAGFDVPYTITIDPFGNVYIGEWSMGATPENRVRKINTAGIVSTVAGSSTAGYSGDGGPATAAELNLPAKVCSDASGNICEVDANNNRIRELFFSIGYVRFFSETPEPFSLCENSSAYSLDSFLEATDTSIGHTVVWSLVLAPVHGTTLASFSTTSTGLVLTPSGLLYTPASGYSGNDSFKVSVNDGSSADTLTIFVTINALPSAITGAATIDTGLTITLIDATGGGTWSSSDTAVAKVGSSSAVLTGVSAGTATITYTLSSGCFVAERVTVNALPTSVQILSAANGVSISPNPAHESVTLTAGNIENGAVSIKLFNLWGKVVVSEMTTVNNNYLNEKLDMQYLPSGIYILSIADISGNFIRLKLVKN